ncbi:MBOAT family O-acyltransferase [Marinimicrococcus flavescens]|uniref:Probable alginate O-acetylase AlgI n=1 Tax=Marinimicrococcus flavescens TaxID=3031815 RepID=A0AAP3XS74_9PROT|nr:MBOAT family protein [Marinimicrococcus flavescens]
MLFSSEFFVLVFLPTVWLGYQSMLRMAWPRAAAAWLVISSLVFYSWFEPLHLLLLLGMIVGNYGAGLVLARLPQGRRRLLLTLAIGADLGILAYYKYANFLIANLNALSPLELGFQTIVLPIGISFFTFQLVAWLVDAHKGAARDYGFLDFCLFVCFFPQLIAGPIVHHAEMIPQFRQLASRRPGAADIAGGLILFTIGLFKKIVIADHVAPIADSVFAAAETGASLDPLSAWCGTLAFTVQIYFDFSAYSDMALGMGLLFGIRLPINFASPYKAVSIIDFWRRWHITLSRFLRDYVYIPLGGNRRGPSRRHVNLLATMLIGGLWHGAAWTFVAWGALHGLYLVVNHAWQVRRDRLGLPAGCLGPAGPWLARSLTFFCVAAAWVFFRAESFGGAAAILAGLAGATAGAPTANATVGAGELVLLLAILAGTWFLPNAPEIAAAFRPALEPVPEKPVARLVRRLVEAPTAVPLVAGVATSSALVLVLAYQGFNIDRMQAFIYFQF